MISKVGAGSAAYTQHLSSKEQKAQTKAVEKTQEMDKIESIKEQIQKGEYKLDSQKTAEAIAKDLM